MPYRSMDTEEVADYLHLTVAEITEYVKTNQIPHQVRGGRVVFLRGEIDAWASQQILALENQKLVDYHKRSTRDTRSVLDQDALIPELIKPAYINVALEARTKRSAIHAMIDLAESTGRVLDVCELQESVEAREELCPTALPGGLAILHCRHHEAYRFDGSFMVFGRSIQDLPFGAPDGRSTRLFFLLCCQDEKLHLHALARICLMAQRTDLLSHLREAPDRDALYEALYESELAALAGKKRLDTPQSEEPSSESGA